MRSRCGSTGWHNIPRLGVFLWRLQSCGVGPVTPVAVHGCPGWYTFDPTGRDVPLFCRGARRDAFGDNWISPTEAQLPAPISQQLLERRRRRNGAASRSALYPDTRCRSHLRLTDPPEPSC